MLGARVQSGTVLRRSVFFNMFSPAAASCLTDIPKCAIINIMIDAGLKPKPLIKTTTPYEAWTGCWISAVGKGLILGRVQGNTTPVDDTRSIADTDVAVAAERGSQPPAAHFTVAARAASLTGPSPRMVACHWGIFAWSRTA